MSPWSKPLVEFLEIPISKHWYDNCWPIGPFSWLNSTSGLNLKPTLTEVWLGEHLKFTVQQGSQPHFIFWESTGEYPALQLSSRNIVAVKVCDISVNLSANGLAASKSWATKSFFSLQDTFEPHYKLRHKTGTKCCSHAVTQQKTTHLNNSKICWRSCIFDSVNHLM